jgi:hypothetical protein
MNSSPWIREDNVVDMHIDCEFVDDASGFTFISIGAVLRCNHGLSKTFYGIDKDYFAGSKFREHVLSKDNENVEWMWDNVYKHIEANVQLAKHSLQGGTTSDLTSMRELLKDPNQFNTLSITYNQDYPVVKKQLLGDKLDGVVSENLEIVQHDPDVLIVGTQKAIALGLTSAINSMVPDQHPSRVRIFTYYGNYDTFALNRLFGGMHAMPDWFDYQNYDFRSIGDAFGLSHDDYNPHTLHNALGDAVAQYDTMRKMRDQIVLAFGSQLKLSTKHSNW